LVGRAYGEWLRRGRIAIAPVHQEMAIRGVRQPGDQDTTRTYNLAAAFCFFLHRRTPYVQTIYDEITEVPMWDDAEELAILIRKYLVLEDERRAMAVRAHARAVPAYSIPIRAEQIVHYVEAALAEERRAAR
jgi:spore maturation protein CgeB